MLAPSNRDPIEHLRTIANKWRPYRQDGALLAACKSLGRSGLGAEDVRVQGRRVRTELELVKAKTVADQELADRLFSSVKDEGQKPIVDHAAEAASLLKARIAELDWDMKDISTITRVG